VIRESIKKLLGASASPPPTEAKYERGVSNRGADELDRLADRIVAGASDAESRALAIARWIAENVTNKRPNSTGVEAVAREGRGFCGGRARLFVELANRAGLEAQVYGMYNRGLRHTVAQVRLDGKWRFVDPMYGAVFRRDGALLSFDEAREESDRAPEFIQVLGGTADTDGLDDQGREKPLDHIAKVHTLYAPGKLANARSNGFLYGEEPVVHFPVVDLADSQLPMSVADSSADGKAFTKAAARTFGTPLPDFIGATNRKVVWSWRFQGADPNKPVAIDLTFKRLPKQPLRLSVRASNADVVYGGETIVGGPNSARSWRIVVVPGDSAPVVDLAADFEGWNHAVKIERVEVRTGGTVSDLAAETPATEEAAPVRDGAASAEGIRPEADADALYAYLEGCGIAQTVRNGAFHEYKKRPGGWAWVYHGTAAIFAYRATGDIRYLRWIAEIFEVMANSRDCHLDRIDAYRGRACRSWGAQVKDRNAGGMCWVNEVCTAGTMALPAALFAAEVQADPGLHDEFGAIAARFAEVCREVADEFEADRVDLPDRPESYFVMPHDGGPEPLAHAAPFAAMLVALYRAAGRDGDYRTAERLANYFRAAIREEDGGVWSWPYRPTPDAMHGPGEYFFKARVTLIFPIHAFALGLLFDRSDLEKFADTVLAAVCRSDGRLYTTVSRENGKALIGAEYARFEEKGRLGSLAQAIGFYPLAGVKPSVANRLSGLMTDYSGLFPKGWFSTPSSIEAYAFELDPDAALNIRK
jgi:hypothetical protein